MSAVNDVWSALLHWAPYWAAAFFSVGTLAAAHKTWSVAADIGYVNLLVPFFAFVTVSSAYITYDSVQMVREDRGLE